MKNRLEQKRLRVQLSASLRAVGRDFADLELWGLIVIGVTLVLFR